MIRKIIEIDEEKCDGCGLCIPACPEGAIKLVKGKAKLVRDFYCDGLGACLGHCPQGAIKVIEREAEEYDESQVMRNVMEQGQEAVQQHLQHLRDHGEYKFLKEALSILKENKQNLPDEQMRQQIQGCPGAQSFSFRTNQLEDESQVEDLASALTHWPIQMHLITPMAPQYQNADLLLAADCVAFVLGNFHQKHLRGKTLAIACPKLDQAQQVYKEKLKTLIDTAGIKSLQVMVMQVPCCSGLLRLAQSALKETKRKIPIDVTIVGIQGQILDEFQIE